MCINVRFHILAIAIIFVGEGSDDDSVYYCMCTFRLLLYQDVSHDFNELRPIIKTGFVCNDSARVGVIVWPSCTKPDSDINITAVISIVGEKADPCFWSPRLPISFQWVKIKPLFVAINRRGRIWANQGPPCVTTQIGRTVLSVGDQWVQGICSLVDDNEPELLADLHTETDLGEWCVPVSR